MKQRGLIILVIALVLGACMFLCSRMLMRQQVVADMTQENGTLLPELSWLRDGLKLDAAQFEQVKALHLAYQPQCVGLCERVRKADETLLLAAKQPQADVTAELRARAELRIECQQAMLKHIRQTAACMNPQQARQYLDTTLPYALGLHGGCGAAH